MCNLTVSVGDIQSTSMHPCLRVHEVLQVDALRARRLRHDLGQRALCPARHSSGFRLLEGNEADLNLEHNVVPLVSESNRAKSAHSAKYRTGYRTAIQIVWALQRG